MNTSQRAGLFRRLLNGLYDFSGALAGLFVLAIFMVMLGTSAMRDCLRVSGNASCSINEVVWRFRSFGINNLEMVAQIFPRWNRVADWLREAERFSTAA